MGISCVYLIISGKVQGVGYRYYAKRKAENLGLTSWIRNTSNGHVESRVEGTKQAVQDFINWAHQGPDNAVVSNIIQKTLAEQPAFENFEIHS